MSKSVEEILLQDDFNKEDIVRLLKSDKIERNKLYKRSAEVKSKYVGNLVHFRGLIEFTNICEKDCLYCGIRKSNKDAHRYNLSDEEIIGAAKFAYENRYGSVVLQGGELTNKSYVGRIENLLKEIKRVSNGELGITISLGEEDEATYKRWFDAGAHRYLLRIESSNEDLYYKIHPKDELHNYQNRLECLKRLQRSGYQTGTGVMIGLPFQTYEDLANDILLMKELDIDMCGMGPYIEHTDTPLYEFKDTLMPLEERFNLTLKMIAILRIVMKDINIAAATALQAIDKIGREKAIKVGANIIMPNITPGKYRDDYALYQNKPCTDEEADDCANCLEARVNITGDSIGYGEWGDSNHFKRRTSK
ncbi:MAG: [FeFe] hydrogenase H-cluster radical SAM maturase HydE [Bacteroidales bacterium]|jgi:biotin synthase|nr:[FeFe] hydrogenase H-cluster radical SAM maturase HydE [Bacteroidales bacterium]